MTAADIRKLQQLQRNLQSTLVDATEHAGPGGLQGTGSALKSYHTKRGLELGCGADALEMAILPVQSIQRFKKL